MANRPAGTLGLRRGAVVQGPPAPSQNLSINVDAIYAVVAARAQKVVEKAGRMANGSARERAPVRKVFSGGRRTRPRFYSLTEAKTELPAYLRGMRPSGMARGRRGELTKQQALKNLLATPIATSRNRANSWRTTGTRPYIKPIIGPYVPAEREVGSNKSGFFLMKPGAEYGLTTRGRYELTTGRAISAGEGHQTAGRALTEADLRVIRGNEAQSEGHLGGSLRRSVHLEDRSSGSVVKVSIVAGGEDAPYARFVEFGTRHAPAQPYLRPALKHVEGPFKTMMREAFPGSR